MIKLSFKKKLNHIIIMSGGVKINFRLMKRGYDLVLGHILPISHPPPLQVIISQSLITLFIFSIIYSVINIYKYFNIAIEYQIKLYIIHVLSVLKSKSIQWSIINAVFWLVELLLGYVL